MELMEKYMRIFSTLMVTITALLLAFSQPLVAKDLRAGTPWKELDPELQKELMVKLKDIFPEGDVISERRPPIGLEARKGDTTGCPENCNGSYSGGMCRCTTDDDGNCPEGTSNPGTGDECTVKKKSYNVIVPGLENSVRVLGF